MSPEAQRIAIAEACGWTKVRLCDSSEQRPMGPYGLPPGFIHEENEIKLPDYLNDLNAMHEAEKVLMDEQARKYASALYDLTNGFKIDDDPWTPDIFEASMDGVEKMVSATATQRAEAFLRTIGKWEEAQ